MAEMQVAIVLADRGWILETLARQIAERVPGVTYGEAAEPSADALYYMTYSARRQPSDKIEIGYFTHIEVGTPAEAKFFEIASAVQYRVCHADLYAGILRERGLDEVHTIPPGVDLDHFTPKLRIGVVGRTYHTGRKGESIVQQLMDLPYIEWRFSGDGWPGPARHPSHAEMPAFYNDLDYVLVPAFYEGGPMCVIEALACGVEVIAPPIGWVPNFPHLEYPTGDVAQLRALLERLYRERLERRRSVLAYTWDRWAAEHEALFTRIGERHGLGPLRRRRRTRRELRVSHVLHGNEARSKGGPSIRVPLTVEKLKAEGIGGSVIDLAKGDVEAADVVHVYNIWQPSSALSALAAARRQGRLTVFSPIFLDLTLRPLWGDQLPQLAADDDARLPHRLFEFTRLVAAMQAEHDRFLRSFDPVPGYVACLREALTLADVVVCLSEHEKHCLETICGPQQAITVIHNPVDAGRFEGVSPTLFAETFGLDDYVLCVGRIEPRKNQLALAMALAGSDLTLVLVGHVGDAGYANLVLRHGGDNVRHIDRLPPNSDLLTSAYLGARAFAAPSWAEGASLAVLEAAASGTRLVLSDLSGERDYYGKRATYVHPADLLGWRSAIEQASANAHTPNQVTAQRRFIETRYGWPAHIRKLSRVYGRAA